MSDEGNGRAAISTNSERRVVGRPFQPGQSGNPNGRSKIAAEVRALAQQHCPEAIATLAELMRTSPDERVRLSAAEAILDRGVGRPIQAVEVTHEDRRLPDALEELRRSERGQHLLELAEAIAAAQQTAGAS